MATEKRNRIHFFKMTGAGNDFVFIDNREGAVDADRCGDFVRSICRRKLSVGADGLVLIERDKDVDFKWRFFNSDASEAEMCGNAARCAVRFAHLTGIAGGSEISFRTLAGIIRGTILESGVKVQMTTPHGLQQGIRLEGGGRTLLFDFLDTGVPHAVCLVADEKELEAMDVEGLGRTFRFHPHFHPAGANINFTCIEDPHRMRVRTYERGVEGETLACGTGVLAAALTSAARKRVLSPVTVGTRGGEWLKVYCESPDEKGNFGKVFMEGEARVVYEADLYLH
jgi:diaminopimelate epimerase